VGVASAPQISDYGTWEDCGGKDNSLRTPIAQPIGRGVFPSGAMPDLAFLINPRNAGVWNVYSSLRLDARRDYVQILALA
jgi:hypothetical protein